MQAGTRPVGGGVRASGAAAAALLVAVAGCAREFAPPGGIEDRTPPRVVSINPEPFAVTPGFRGAVVFQFDERISERGLEDAVIVTPITGEVRVRHGRSAVSVTVAGGWRPGVVYRVLLRPRVQDLFGNRMTAPVEALFSTGPEIPHGAFAGLVTDRITGRPVAAARVEATEEATGLVHLAVSDSSGFFDLPNLPAGIFNVTAYVDQSRNRRLDPFEPRAVTTFQLAEADTVVAALAVLPPDTTPARLVQAEPRDSVHLRLTFDDFLHPDHPAGAAWVAVWELSDTTAVRDSVAVAVGGLMHPWEAAAPAAAADTAPAEPRPEAAPPPARRQLGPVRTAPERGRLGPERTDEAAEAVPGQPADPAVDTVAAAARRPIGPLPTRELLVLLAAPLRPETWYRVSVGGVVNIVGLPDGGGSALVQTPAPRPEPPVEEADEEPEPPSEEIPIAPGERVAPPARPR
jgi:hypothetical protein